MDGGNADIAGARYLSFIKSVLQTLSQSFRILLTPLAYIPVGNEHQD
jgi:hypothetical protein